MKRVHENFTSEHQHYFSLWGGPQFWRSLQLLPWSCQPRWGSRVAHGSRHICMISWAMEWVPQPKDEQAVGDTHVGRAESGRRSKAHGNLWVGAPQTRCFPEQWSQPWTVERLWLHKSFWHFVPSRMRLPWAIVQSAIGSSCQLSLSGTLGGHTIHSKFWEVGAVPVMELEA